MRTESLPASHIRTHSIVSKSADENRDIGTFALRRMHPPIWEADAPNGRFLSRVINEPGRPRPVTGESQFPSRLLPDRAEDSPALWSLEVVMESALNSSPQDTPANRSCRQISTKESETRIRTDGHR
jgi:hypothetical protein